MRILSPLHILRPFSHPDLTSPSLSPQLELRDATGALLLDVNLIQLVAA